ncbi:unnamed protein product, partial [Amoebophrya sp. A120]
SPFSISCSELRNIASSTDSTPSSILHSRELIVVRWWPFGPLGDYSYRSGAKSKTNDFYLEKRFDRIRKNRAWASQAVAEFSQNIHHSRLTS